MGELPLLGVGAWNVQVCTHVTGRQAPASVLASICIPLALCGAAKTCESTWAGRSVRGATAPVHVGGESVCPQSVWCGMNECGAGCGVEPCELGFVSATPRAHTQMHTHCIRVLSTPVSSTSTDADRTAAVQGTRTHRGKHTLLCVSPSWPSAPLLGAPALLPAPAPGQCAPWPGAQASSAHQLSDTKRRVTHLQRGFSFKD